MTAARMNVMAAGKVPSVFWVLALLALQAAMAIAMKVSSGLATAQSLLVIAACVCVAAVSRKPEMAACAAAYVVGSEVVWRMSRASTLYEVGKYATTAVLLAGLMRMGKPRIEGKVAFYFAALIPSALITIMLEDWDFASNALSFNLAGHLTMTVAMLFFYNVRLTPVAWTRVLLALIIPLASAAAIAIFGIQMAEQLIFRGASSRLLSGGFGPNQVSAALGLGAFLSFLALMSTPIKPVAKALMGALMVLFLAQSALTFSRGGLYCGIGAILVAAQFLVRDPRTRGRLLVALPVIYVVGAYVIFPQLDEFTGGALSARLSDTGSTGRSEIALSELQSFFASPLFGSGVGRAERSYAGYEGSAAAHTEFTRVIAEHGMFGLAALGLLAAIGLQRFTSGPDRLRKALVASMMAWSVLFMLNVAMRLAAPSFLIGLACARFVSDKDEAALRLRRRPASRTTMGAGGRLIRT